MSKRCYKDVQYKQFAANAFAYTRENFVVANTAGRDGALPARGELESKIKVCFIKD